MPRLLRLALAPIVIALLLAAGPALAQGSVVGLWVSEDGGTTFHLTTDSTYELTGDLAIDEPQLTGRYAVPEGVAEIIARANERSGAIRFTIVELGSEHLILVSDVVFGGSMTFTRPSAIAVAIDRALSGYALFWLVVMMGGAVMTGQALGRTWQPLWKTVPYAVLIGLANVCPSMFDARLIHGVDGVMLFIIHTPVLYLAMLIAYFTTRASRMVAQYPWRYRRAGIFGWREVGG